MDKISFSNLPSTTTPVNATNLNQIQTNVDNAKIEAKAIAYDEDLNDLKTTGFYTTYTNTTNKPDTGSYFIEVIAFNVNYLMQRATKRATGTDIVYQRYCNNGTWGSWHIIGGETITTFSNSDLSNDWATNGQCNGVVLPNGTKILTISVRYGTSTEVMTLPTALRPASTVGALAGASNASGYVTIGTDGTVTASSNIFSSGSSNLRFTVMYI